ncbi:BamA/TamA family outer membrane protein [Adhaeribacter aquaticus]|uniref:BamA/TamA family outer membrane protein n=1 Tax=Adhaeribacter aquaticus TaxID=299567 RepID=UPI000428799F|nr:BamA/TamA family outer membrane protein [Adhaeribacter aquaticus]
MKATFWKLAALAFIWILSVQEIKAQVADTIYQIRKLEITGNRKTKNYIITRELDLVVNDTISSRTLRSRLERNRQRVYNTRLFVYTRIKPTFDGDQVDIQLEVKENWYIGGGVVFKLVDRNFNEWWNDRDRDLNRVIYGASLSHANFRGRRERLRLVGETGFSDRFQASYDIPYIDKKQQTGLFIQAKYRGFKNVAYNIANDKLLFTNKLERDIKTQIEGLVQIRKRWAFNSIHRLELSYAYDHIADTLLKLNPFYHRNQKNVQRYMQLAYLYTYDTRDNVNFAVKGEVVEGSIRRRGLLPNDNYNSLEIKIGGAYYRLITNRWSYGLMSKAQVTFPRNIPFNQIRGLGYSDEFLRGFDLYVINGTSFALGKADLRFKFFDKIIPAPFIPVKQFNTLPLATYINFFADAAYVINPFAQREINNNLSNQRISSAGVGLAIVALMNTTIRINFSRNSIVQNNVFVNLQKDF